MDGRNLLTVHRTVVGVPLVGTIRAFESARKEILEAIIRTLDERLGMETKDKVIEAAKISATSLWPEKDDAYKGQMFKTIYACNQLHAPLMLLNFPPISSPWYCFVDHYLLVLTDSYFGLVILVNYFKYN